MKIRYKLLGCIAARTVAAGAAIGRSVLASAALAAVVGVASTEPTSAAMVTATYTGTVKSGFDLTGDFGPGFTSLTGDPFTVVYTINDAAPGAVTVTDSTSYSYIYGGGQYATTSPVSAVVTINGHSWSFPGTFYGIAVQSAPSYGNAGVYEQAQGQNGSHVINSITSKTDLFTTSFDYHTPLSHQVQPDDASTGDMIFVFAGTEHFQADFTNTSVTISGTTVSGVPELATWAMMIIGFGGVALQLRRRELASLTA